MSFSRQEYVEKIQKFINENVAKGYSVLKISYSNVIELQKQRIRLIGFFEQKKHDLTQKEHEQLKTLSFKLNIWLQICIQELKKHYNRLVKEEETLRARILTHKNSTSSLLANEKKEVNATITKLLIQEKTLKQIIHQEKKVISHLNQIMNETDYEMKLGIPYSVTRAQQPKPTPSSPQQPETSPSLSSKQHEPSRTDNKIKELEEHDENPYTPVFNIVTKPIPNPSQSPFFEAINIIEEEDENFDQEIPLPDIPIFDSPIKETTIDVPNPPSHEAGKELIKALSSIPLPNINAKSSTETLDQTELRDETTELSQLRLEMLKELTHLRSMLKGKI